MRRFPSLFISSNSGDGFRAAPLLALLAAVAGAVGTAASGCRARASDTNVPPFDFDGGGDDGGGPSTDATVPPPPVADSSIGSDDVTYVRVPYDAGAPAPVARIAVHAETVSTRTDVQSLMFAAGEMQQSGEPFAQHFAGRNLNDYDRTFLPPDDYLLPVLGDAGAVDGAVNDQGFGEVLPIKDLFGFSTAVESYEYSKMHMNMVAQQTTAGLSLADGPVVAARAEGTPLSRLQARASELLTAAGTDVGLYAQLPPPVTDAGLPNPLNYLGFNGLWPSFAAFRDFDPTMAPSAEVIAACTFVGGYGGIPTLGQMTPEFECAYNTLHLPNRDAQVNKTLVPAVLGFATWKEALWGIDFAGRLHDSGSNPVNAVAPADSANVGKKGNTVVGTDPPGAVAGTYLGSTPLEDMWGLFMLDEMDNLAEFLVDSLTTADGATLGGFASKLEATSYDYTSPLRWFPASVSVVEDETVVPYPAIQRLAIIDPSSRAIDLAGLLIGNAMFFGMTDARNAGVGQRNGLLLTFDGDPFPADDGVADGENTAHDRTLAVLRAAFVDLDRMHFVPLPSAGVAEGVTVDTATVSAGVATPGSAVTATTLAHVVLGLRQALLAVNGAITQYGAADPDPAIDLQGILNTPPLHPTAPGAATSYSARVRQVFTADADFVMNVLSKSDGTVANGATIANGVATPLAGAATLESQGAALRSMSEAFLVTGNQVYLARGQAIARVLLTQFYSAPALLFRGVQGGADDVQMTPEIFGWLQSALRETHKVLSVQGDPLLDRSVLEPRIARVNKLFLNGWDDLNGDMAVQKGTECLAGRLQQGEQALTGELGSDLFGQPTTDRDQDCVPDIDGANLGSVLASQVHFHSP